MTGWTGSGTRTFLLDTKLPVAGDDAGGATGAQTSTYYVYVAKDPTVPTAGSTVATTITIRRPLQMVKNSDLNFGTLVRQPSGASASVVVNNSTGIRTQTGNANLIALPSPSPSRAQFTITGEPSTTFAISYSPTGNITMSNGASTLSVTTSKTATGNQTMPATGTLTLGVGGTISVLSTTARGEYSGNLTVTTTYN
jgi:sucrose-6-phosphate hydrolase SacC (GH32 family)